MKVVRMASPGNSGSKPSDQILDMLPRGLSAHGSKHGAVNMLERHIHIPCNLRVARNRGDQLATPMRRMRIEKPHPKLAFDHRELIEQLDKRRTAQRIHWLARTSFFRPPIHPEVGRVLTYEVNFLDSLGDQIADLRSHGFDRATPVTPPHLRNHAKTAWMIAALGNLHVGGMGGR